MSPRRYSEDSIVEQPAIQFFAELGWKTGSASEEAFSVGGWLNQEMKDERGLVKLLNPLHSFASNLLIPRLLFRKIAV